MDMPVVLPSSFTDNIQGWSSGTKLPDLSNAITILRETWDLQTFSNLQAGKVSVPDDVINQSLDMALEDGEQVQKLTIESQEDHKLKVTALTKKAGRVVMVCQVEQMEHDKDHSVIKLKALDKKLPDKPLLSWIFSRVSLAMVTKVVGHIDPGQGLAMNIRGNEVTVDFHQALYQSRFGGLEIFGCRPLDYLTIYGATPYKGYVEFQTNLELPDQIGSMFQNALQTMEGS